MDNIPVEQIGELLDKVSGTLPKIINGIMGSMFSAEAGKNMGQAVGNLYKEMVSLGIPQEDALKMAKDYMLSIKDISGNFTNKNQNSDV